jgi:hypothetical protein
VALANPNVDSWLWPRVLARTRRERAELVDELRRAAVDADDVLFDLLKRTIDALEICEHQLSQVLPPGPGPVNRRIADTRREMQQRMRRQKGPGEG